MPFEPRVVDDEDAYPVQPGNEELDLPDDLMILAESLEADAQRLAERYPSSDRRQSVLSEAPGKLTPQHTDHPAWRKWQTMIAGLLAVALALPLGGAVATFAWFTSPSNTARQPAATVTPPPQSAAPRQLAASPSPDRNTSDHGLRNNPSPSMDAARPVLFLQEVSGPELEGLLDLMDGASGDSHEISI